MLFGQVHTLDTDKRNIFLSFCFVIAVWIISPILGIIPLLIYLVFVNSSKLVKHLFLLLIALSLGLINSTKIPESDLYNYLNWYEEFYTTDLLEFYTIRFLDPFFYFITALLSKISYAYSPIFLLFWTIVIYYTFFLTILELSKIFNLNKKWSFAIIAYTAFIGFGFSLTGHLVRQCVAESFLLYSFALLLNNNKNAKWFFLLSIFSHFSFLIFAPLYFFLKKTNFSISSFKLKFLIFVLIALVTIVGQVNVLTYFSLSYTGIEGIDQFIERTHLYIEKNDGEVSFRMFAEFFFFVLVCYILTLFGKQNKIEGQKIFLILFYMLILLLLFRNTDLFLLRYFFITFALVSFSLPYILKSNSKSLIFLVFLLVISSPIRFFRMLENSEWDYINNDFNIVFNSLVDYIIYIN